MIYQQGKVIKLNLLNFLSPIFEFGICFNRSPNLKFLSVGVVTRANQIKFVKFFKPEILPRVARMIIFVGGWVHFC